MHIVERIKDIVENIVPTILCVVFIKFSALQSLMFITNIKQIKLNNNINRKIIKFKVHIDFQKQ